MVDVRQRPAERVLTPVAGVRPPVVTELLEPWQRAPDFRARLIEQMHGSEIRCPRPAYPAVRRG